MILRIVIVVLMLITSSAMADVYSWVDEDKVQHFSEKHRKAAKNIKTIPVSPKPSALKTKPISDIDAKRIVKSLPCSKGGTIDNHLRNKTKSPEIKDLGWSVQRLGNQFIVEKTIDVGFSSHTIFRWSVDTEGVTKPINGYAIGITKQKKSLKQ